MFRNRLFYFSSIVILVMLLSAVSPVTVYADDGTPATPTVEETVGDPPVQPDAPEVSDNGTETPAPPSDETGVDSTETPIPTLDEGDQVATETPVPTSGGDQVDATETPVPTATGTGDEQVADDTSTSEVTETPETTGTEEPDTEVTNPLDQIPDNTDLVVLNENGEAEPLATVDAVAAVNSGDPIWCPDGQPPMPGQNGCTQSFSSFDDLLTFLAGNETDALYQQSGTIFVSTGAYQGGEQVIDFNSYGFNNLNQYDLTLQGGWDTTSNVVDDTTTSDLTQAVVIGTDSNPWIGSVVISNIIISGVNNQTALTVYSNSDVGVYNSEFSDNRDGMDVNAGGNIEVINTHSDNNKKSGAKFKANGTVDIEDSTFNGNKSGLQVSSGDSISLSSVQANNNGLFGADLAAVVDAAISSSTFSGNYAYTSSRCSGYKVYGYGLRVQAGETIALSDVTADDNGLFGADLKAGDEVAIFNGEFSNNGFQYGKLVEGYGLAVESGSKTSLLNVHADHNNLFGANIKSVGDVSISNGTFSGNYAYTSNRCSGYEVYGYGLQVQTDENIALNNVATDENYLFGANLQAGQNVSILGSSFSDNRFDKSNKVVEGYGLKLDSGGDVSLLTTQANGNNLFGADINSVGPVAILSSVFSGNHAYTCSYCGGYNVYGYGLQVNTDSSITLGDVQANDNYLFGANLIAAGSVSLADSTFNANGFQKDNVVKGYGLKIESGASVALSNVSADQNKLFGSDITSVGDVSILNSTFSGNYAYTSSRCKGYEVYGYGLQVQTDDKIKLDGVTANNNYLFGANLKAGSDVTVQGSTFSENGFQKDKLVEGYGLAIETDGSVVMSDSHADNNKLFGANIDAMADVAISNSTFSGNYAYTSSHCSGYKVYGYGLQIQAGDDIAVENVTADNNYLFGANLKAGGDVAVLGSEFSNNGFQKDKLVEGYGLAIESGNRASLLDVHADHNKLFGADVEAVGDVSILTGTFSGNYAYTSSYCGGYKVYGYGLQVQTDGNVALNNVVADDNYLYGSYLEAGKNVSIMGSSFSNNRFDESKKTIEGYGLQVYSGGNVSLLTTQANGNSLFGADIDSVGSVAILNSTFSGNHAYTCSYCGGYNVYGYGLQVNTDSYLALGNVQANDNYLFGANLYADGSVSISDSTFNNNRFDKSNYVLVGYGLKVNSGDSVALSDTQANDNSLFGARIYSELGTSIYNSTFSGNQLVYGWRCWQRGVGYGLQVISNGDINLDGVTASDNYEYGAKLDSDGTITVDNSTFSNNLTSYGLSAYSDGDQIKVTLTTVSDNGYKGAIFAGDVDLMISDSSFTGNHGYDYYITVTGNVTLDNVTADNGKIQ